MVLFQKSIHYWCLLYISSVLAIGWSKQSGSLRYAFLFMYRMFCIHDHDSGKMKVLWVSHSVYEFPKRNDLPMTRIEICSKKNFRRGAQYLSKTNHRGNVFFHQLNYTKSVCWNVHLSMGTWYGSAEQQYND